MPSTAPTLTWDMTILRNSATPNSAQAALDTLELLVGDSTYWEKDTGAFGSGAGAGFLIITPVGGNQPDMQVVFCFNPASGAMSPVGGHTTQATTLFMGLCPDGGADSDPLLAAGPTDSSGERFTGYLRISQPAASVDADTLFVLDSDEIFGVWIRQDSVIDWYGGIAGAIIDPPTDVDGEGTPGRIYGLSVTGTQEITNTFWSSATSFLSSGGANAFNTQCFDPNAPTVMIEVDRYSITMDTNPRYLTQFGTQVSMPFALFEEAAPNNLIGIMRQIRQATDGTMREVIQNSLGADKSYYIAAHDTSDFDVASFDNG
jgi:hypothetical protein